MQRQLPGTISMRLRSRPASGESGAGAAGDEHAGRRRVGVGVDARRERTTNADRAIMGVAAMVALVVLGTASLMGPLGSTPPPPPSRRLVDRHNGVPPPPHHGVGGGAPRGARRDGGVDGDVAVTSPRKAGGPRNGGVSTSTAPPFGGIDVFVAGFAKCGTTTVRRFFERHPDEYAFLGDEAVVNSILYGAGDRTPGGRSSPSPPPPGRAIRHLEERFHGEATRHATGGGGGGGSIALKTAIKTPRGVLDSSALRLLAGGTTADTRIVIGVRHPVRWFESYYNFRASRLLAQNRKQSIPPADALIGRGKRINGWREICTDNARFDLFLRQLGKHGGALSPAELKDMERYKRYKLRVAPNPYRVFLYHLEQLPRPPPRPRDDGGDDRDDNRADGDDRRRREAADRRFDEDFRDFVRLEGAVGPWSGPDRKRRGDEGNGDGGHVKIDICDGRYGELRRALVGNGKVAAEWIRDRFLPSDDVVVSSEDLFLELLSSWEVDPCGGHGGGGASGDVPLAAG